MMKALTLDQESIFPSMDSTLNTQKYPSNLVKAENLDDFKKIFARDKNILLMDYPLSPDLRHQIDELGFDNLPEINLVFGNKDTDIFAQLEADELIRSLLEYLKPTIQIFCDLFKGTNLKLSLIKTRGQPCPLFHVDKIKFRYLYTILGEGTEWANDCDVKRSGLGKGNNRKVLDENSNVYAADREQVCILKGEPSFALNGRGVVHRSPPQSLTSQGRWLIRIDDMH